MESSNTSASTSSSSRTDTSARAQQRGSAAAAGKDEDMEFICDSKSALLCYATNSPQIDEPSAGYTFAWDMIGNGQYIATSQFDGPPATHTEYIEGLIATDMKKTGDDLAVFLKGCVD